MPAQGQKELSDEIINAICKRKDLTVVEIFGVLQSVLFAYRDAAKEKREATKNDSNNSVPQEANRNAP